MLILNESEEEGIKKNDENDNKNMGERITWP